MKTKQKNDLTIVLYWTVFTILVVSTIFGIVQDIRKVEHPISFAFISISFALLSIFSNSVKRCTSK